MSESLRDPNFESEVNETLKVLHSEQRRKILVFLKDGPKVTRKIKTHLGLTPEGAKIHLDILEKLGVIKEELKRDRDGKKRRYYFLVPDKLRTCTDRLSLYLALLSDPKEKPSIAEKLKAKPPRMERRLYEAHIPEYVPIEPETSEESPIIPQGILNSERKEVNEEERALRKARYESRPPEQEISPTVEKGIIPHLESVKRSIEQITDLKTRYRCIAVVNGLDSGKEFVIRKDRISIGRSKDNDIVLQADDYVAPHHAIIHRTVDLFGNTELHIQVLGTKNGTLLLSAKTYVRLRDRQDETLRVDERKQALNQQLIREGDFLRVGRTWLTIRAPTIA